MGELLAAATLAQVADEQQARNALFPEAVDSPIVICSLAIFCSQLRFVLAFPTNPIRSSVPTLSVFVETASLATAISLGPASVGSFTFVHGSATPSQQQFEDEILRVETSLQSLAPTMFRWRRTLSPTDEDRWNRLTHGLFVTMMELSYFGTFSFVEMLAMHFGEFDRQWLQHLTESARGHGTSP